ncbi:hypothetical protein A5320_18195 [Rheinheimera sp. SA_1]|nr:hypothetical protein A5320_18195 [Rheinheimera sp. SA_1]
MTDLPQLVSAFQRRSHSVGFIGGCFDVLHIGHIEVFRFARKYVDCLCVVLDNDTSIRNNKGSGRPVFNQQIRSEQIAELESVSLVTVWDKDIPSDLELANQRWHSLLESCRPDVLITNSEADPYWREKLARCNILGMQFLDCHLKRLTSSTELVDSLGDNLAQLN